jgi:hypothetical protein
MDYELGPMQGEYWLYDEPARIIYTDRKLELDPSALPQIAVGMVLKLPDGSVCEIATIDKDGQPWCTFAKYEE